VRAGSVYEQRPGAAAARPIHGLPQRLVDDTITVTVVDRFVAAP